jgi:hypothetical protein
MMPERELACEAMIQIAQDHALNTDIRRVDADAMLRRLMLNTLIVGDVVVSEEDAAVAYRADWPRSL